jgi:hypothetical protein
MSTRSSCNASFSPEPSRAHLSSVLYRSLETALTRQCARRYNVGIVLRCPKEASEDDPELKVRVECPGLTQMPVRITVSHAGGNVYDIICNVEEGDTHRFSYSLPGRTKTQRSCAPHLGEELATFLRGELERRLGRILLQSPAAPPRYVGAPES